MPIKILERFVIYPLIFMLLMLFIFIKFEGSGVTEFLNTFVFSLYEVVKKDIPFVLSQNAFVGVMGFFMGYIYGSISIVFKIREVRGTLQIVLGIIKFMISLTLVLYGSFLYFIELLLMPIVYLIMKK